MARIIEFEGRRIEVPDDATDEEVSGILSASSTPAPNKTEVPTIIDPAMVAPPPPLPGADADGQAWYDYAGGTGAQFARGAREGVANLAGLPVDVINNAPRAANLLPGVDGIGPISEKPFLGSKSIDELLGGFGLVGEPPVADGMGQRIARRVGQEVGAAAVPVGGALYAGSKLGAQGARELPALLKMFVEPAAVGPRQFVQKEAGAALGAGLGAGVANEMVDRDSEWGPLADLVGALFGAGAAGVGSMGVRKGGELVSALVNRPNYVDDVVRQTATDRIIDSSNLAPSAPGEPIDAQPLIDKIMGGERPEDVIPGFKDSLADRTRDPGIASLEYGRQSGPNAGLFAQRRSENTQAVDQAMNANEPGGNPALLREDLLAERDRQLREAILGRDMAEEAAAAAVGKVTPQTSPSQRGNTVREALEGARDAARMRTEEAYSATDIAAKQVNPAALTAAIDNATSGLTAVERGLLPEGLIDRVRALGVPEGGATPAPVSLKEAADLRSELLKFERAALADPNAERGGRNAARVLGQMVDTVDEFIMQNLTPEEAASLTAARGAKFDEAQAFGRAGDPIARALARGEGGVPRMTDDRVARSFVNPQAMDRLFTEADSPAVREAIRDEVLSRGDMTKAERIQKFKADYAEQLQRFPGLADEIDAAAAARGSAAEAAARQTDIERQLGTDGKPGRSTVGKYAAYGDGQHTRALKEVMNAKDPAKAADELLTFVGDDKEAVLGARQAFWDILQEQGRSAGSSTKTLAGDQPWLPGALKKFLDDPRSVAVAERLYRDDPEHLANIRTIAEALQGVDVRLSAKAPNTSGTAQSILPSPETLASRSFAYQRGQVGLPWIVSTIGIVIGRGAIKRAQGEAIERLLDQSLLDPELAALLLRENNPVNRAALARKAKAFLGNEASTIVNEIGLAGEEPGEAEPSLEDQIMDYRAPK